MQTAAKYEHTSVVLQLQEKKGFVLSYRDVVQGISLGSKRTLAELGDEGWELVSVVPCSSSRGKTETLIAFLKRGKN